MAFALVGSPEFVAAGLFQGSANLPTINLGAGESVIIACMTNFNVGVSSIDDGGSNSLTAVATGTQNNNRTLSFWLLQSAVANSSCTFTINYSGVQANSFAYLQRCTGLDASAFDDWAEGNVATNVTVSTNLRTLTTTNANDILFSLAADEDPGDAGLSPPSGFTHIISDNGVGGGGTPVGSFGYQQVTSIQSGVTISATGTEAAYSKRILVIALKEAAPSGVTVTPNTGVSTSLGFAPSVSVSNNINIATGLGSSVSNGFAPSVSVSNNIRIETNVGSSNSLGFAPSIIRPILVSTSLGQSQSQGFAPNVSTSNTIAINTGVNVSQGYAPLVSVSNNVSISTNLGQSNSLGFAPIVSVSQNILIQTGVCLSVSRGFAPIVTGTRVDSVIQPNSNGASLIIANPALNNSVITRNSNNGSVIEP